MRLRLWILSGLLLAWCAATPAATRAHSTSVYSDCVEAADPADCLARRAVASSKLRPREALDTVLRHGLVDLVPDKSAVLARGLDSVPVHLLYPGMLSAMQQGERKSLLAAVALLAAARHEARPFTNPIYIELAHEANDEPRIPVLAMAVWVKYVAMNGWEPDFRVTHAGLPAIWEHAVARRQEDAALLADIAGDLGSLDELKPQARELLVWYLQRHGELTTDQRFRMAAQLARYFEMPEQAASLLEGLDNVPGRSTLGVRTDIAVARLAKGYDAASARQLVNNIVGLVNISRPNLRDSDPGKRDALERSSARNELRELGALYVREADATDYGPFKSEYSAAASDYFLRAGDRERALEMARRSLPYMPDNMRAYGYFTRPARNDPAAKAIAMRGVGTNAVIALYRAGAIDEALKTGYLTSKDRYLNAERAGEKKDPLWMLEVHWPEYFDLMAREAARSNDHEFQQRAYDGLVRSCGTPLANCFAQTLRNIALVAAGMGDGPRMKEALAAVVRQYDKKSDRVAWAPYIAGPWAHCEEVLRKRRAGTAANGRISTSNSSARIRSLQRSPDSTSRSNSLPRHKSAQVGSVKAGSLGASVSQTKTGAYADRERRGRRARAAASAMRRPAGSGRDCRSDQRRPGHRRHSRQRRRPVVVRRAAPGHERIRVVALTRSADRATDHHGLDAPRGRPETLRHQRQLSVQAGRSAAIQCCRRQCDRSSRC